VDALDGVRPRATLYRTARKVAHDMVGEPTWDPDSPTESVKARIPLGAPDLALGLARIQGMGTEQLVRIVRGSSDSRLRIHAMRELASEGRDCAGAVLVALARDSTETVKIRRAAAENLGRLGEVSAPDLESLVRLPETAAGAVRGMAILGTAWAVQRLAALAGDPSPALRAAALEALAEVSNPAAGAELARLLDESGDACVSVAICEALGAAGGAEERAVLVACACNGSRSREERAAALEALGRIGSPDELATVEHIRCDESHQVAEAAQIAAQRLRHRKGLE
jgi:HEAT repeat protein